MKTTIKLLVTFLLVAISLFLSRDVVEAPIAHAQESLSTTTIEIKSTKIQEVATPTVKILTTNDYIKLYSTKYQIPEVWLRNLGWCESRMNQSAVGDSGNAIGMFQYWPNTWTLFTTEFGRKLNRNSSHDQILLTAWALSKGYGYHWTCDYKTGLVREDLKHLIK